MSETVIPFPMSVDDYGSQASSEPEDTGTTEPDELRDEPPPRLSLKDMHGGPIPLGYDHEAHHYLSLTKNQIIELTPASHSEMNLRGMAPFEWYWQNFRGKSKSINWKSAAESLMRWCEQGGVFSVDRIKGRGVHLDNGRIVIHLGNRLMMDGREYPAGRSPVEGSGFVYEAGKAMSLALHKPLTDEQATAYFDLVNRCSWAGSQSAAGIKEQAILAAGWAVVAPICGILPARPNLWVTGESSSGKTWVLDNLLHPAIGPMLVKASLKTTEPGLRRYLRLDALPVAFNEAEARDLRGADVIQKIVELARASYDDQGAEIIMANGKGGSDVFKIRSIFAFLSIGATLRDAADANRTIIVQMQKGMPADEFNSFRRDVAGMVDREFAGRLLARTFSLIPVILDNIGTFVEALVPVIGDRRIADTMAPLLAGYASLRSGKRLSAEAASRIVSEHSWISDHAVEARAEAVPDHKRIVSRIMETLVSTGHGERRSVGELIQHLVDADGDTSQSRLALLRHGIRVEIHGGQWEVWFARAHGELSRIFTDTPWSTTWSRIMRDQYKPAIAERGKQRFGIEAKLTMALPLEVIRAG